MSRQMYETKEDLQRENLIIETVADKWHCKYIKLPIQYRLDFALIRNNKLKALSEIRVRNFSSDKYETIIVSAMKRLTARSLSRELLVPSFFIVKFDDLIKYIDFDESPDSFEVGGRIGNTRRDADDVEIVCHYKIDRLKPL